MAMLLEGLGFNLCVALFLNICDPNLPQGRGQRLVRGCQNLVGGAILEMGKRKLSQRRVRINKGNEIFELAKSTGDDCYLRDSMLQVQSDLVRD